MKKPYVVEAINFLHELDLLEAHLDEHYKFMDKIVVVESEVTYSGMKKPLLFQENKARFAKYPNVEHEILPVDKFEPIPKSYPKEEHKKWFDMRRHNREIQQRHIFAKYRKEGDYVCNSDTDEIWSSDHWGTVYDLMKEENCYIAPHIRRFFYFVDAVGGAQDHWRITKSTQDTHVRQRGTKRDGTPYDIGWHFTSMFKDPKDLWMKGVGLAQSIGFDGWTQVTSPEEIEAMLERGDVPYLRGQTLQKRKKVQQIDDLSWLPPFMRDNPHLWKWLPAKFREGKRVRSWKPGPSSN